MNALAAALPEKSIEEDLEERYPMQIQPLSVEAFKRVIPAFLELFATSCNITASARKLGFNAAVVRQLAVKDPVFEERLELARIEATDALEAEARRRAIYGERKLITYKGFAVKTPRFDEYGDPIRDPITDKVLLFPLYETKRSDKLMELLLRGHRPDRFTQKHDHLHEVTGKVGVLVVPAKLAADEWALQVAAAPRPGEASPAKPEEPVVDAEFEVDSDDDWLT